MMADVVTQVIANFAARGIVADVLDGKSHPARELFAADGSGLPKPRIVFIENGLSGNVADRFGPPIVVGANQRSPLARYQGVEIHVWAFDLTADATPAMHRAATNALLHDLLLTLASLQDIAKEQWESASGTFDGTVKEIEFGALYTLTIWIGVPVVFPARTIATPPSNTTATITVGSTTTTVQAGI